MTAPRLLSPFVRTRARLSVTIGLVLAALAVVLVPWWWQPDDTSARETRQATEAKRASTGPRDESAAVAEAARSGKKVLVDTATTSTSLTWALPGGQLRTQTHALPQRAKNAEGAWAPVDNTLKRVNGAPDGLGVVPVNAVAPVRFSSGGPSASRGDRSYRRAPLSPRTEDVPAGESVLAEVVIHGNAVSYTWPGPLPEPVLSGPRALYPDVLPGVDLLVVAREEGGFAQLLIVKTPEAARNKALATVSYGLRSATARFRHEAGTSRVLVEDANGVEIGSIPTPFAWDSSGRDPEGPGEETPASVRTPDDVLRLPGLSGMEPGARQAPMPLRFDSDAAGVARLHLDVAATRLLTDTTVKFPVFVDPTLNSGWQAWTTAYKPYPNSSFYNGTNFSSGTSDARVGHESDTGGTARSFWRMGYSSSIKGATVSRATFKVLNNHSWSCSAREFQFYLTGAISSGTTWNAQPSWSTLLQKKSFAHGWSSSSCPDSYEAFDVKAAAQRGADSGWSSLTFGMRASSEGDTQTWRKFRATSAVLEVDYNRAPKEPTSGTSSPGGPCVPGPGAGVTVGKTNITLTANASDADGNLKGLRFRFWKTGGTVPAGTLVTPNSNGWASLVIPSTLPLEDQTTYSWDVRSEDTAGAVSTFLPPGAEPCRMTVDASAPAPPTVTSTDFPAATADGATWATVKFGGTGSLTLTSAGATKFKYGFEGLGFTEVAASNGTATVPGVKPPHAGPNGLQAFALDASGNQSTGTYYTFYVPPRDAADSPGDLGGDGIVDLLVITADGKLQSMSGSAGGELYAGMPGSYTKDKQLDPAGHWYDPATGKAALISHFQDVYPGDGSTDLFAVTPDGGFYLYPGDGYGSFNVNQRLDIELPAGTPDPSTWTQIKAVGDVTGDKLPDLFLRAGTAFWVLTGYTGATFQQATLMNGGAWAGRDIVNVGDINKDGTPDLLWRDLTGGGIKVRHGKPGAGAGSVDLDSLKLAANSLGGDVSYGTGWDAGTISAAIGIPDVNGDQIPDIWARNASNGHITVYYPSTTQTNGPAKTVLSVDWNTIRSFG
ncbi:DNRLRE domain-containing protein [Streptomyces sp. NBC_01216]|uniref:FG-GAP-like repeat-containing protein n=1 Tax=Streptomyces sp. NBC_01216 TaxID=2903778 RepID=UPI002E0D586B|nr:DNRLRE domain-containing protein [Streptomyces sp. NBC_01216]